MFTFTGKASLKNQQGFSLVELMVVVAIIGILAAIGIPSMTKYIAKSRQSEAKMNLAGIYTAEKAFLAEYNIYAACFDAIGFQPEGRLRYRVGFPSGMGTGMSNATVATYGYSGNCTDLRRTTAAVCGVGQPCTELAEATGAAIVVSSVIGNTGFNASAGGLIYQGLDDGWRISGSKTLTNNLPGIP